jgi:hypothetical protein
MASAAPSPALKRPACEQVSRTAKLIPRLLDGGANGLERAVVTDHHVGVFEALSVGKLGGDAGTYLFGGEMALFSQAIDHDSL